MMVKGFWIWSLMIGYLPSLSLVHAATLNVPSQYLTIQACVDNAQPGDECLIQPGRYNEIVETKRPGLSGNVIVLRASGKVFIQGFLVKHPYTRIEGFEITADGFAEKLEVGFGAAIYVDDPAHHVEIIGNHIHDLFAEVSGLKIDGDDCIVKRNRVSRPGSNPMIALLGSRILVESNTFDDNAGWDVLRLFGTNNVFRLNYVNNLYGVEGLGNHPDFVQSFGNSDGSGGTPSHSHLIEKNFLSNFQSQIGQVSPFMADQRDWTFRDNVIFNTKLNFSQSLPGLTVENNTMYRVNTEGGGFTGFSNNPPRGINDRGTVRNNLFLAMGDGTSGNRGGFYSVSSDVLDTFYGDYNFYTSAAPLYEAKRTDGCNGLDTPYRFCEEHGINGGNPMLIDEGNPLGADGIPFTLDDGLKPRPDSPLCSGGAGGTTIGAYSCDPNKVFSDAALPPVPPVVGKPREGGGDSSTVSLTWLPFQTAFVPAKGPLAIRYTGEGATTLTVYDRKGSEVKSLSGSNGQAVWDGKNDRGEMVSSGTYLLVLKNGSKIIKKKVVVVK